ncbi:MAG: DUF922 domain-containing protein [Pseudomonadota bacterium]
MLRFALCLILLLMPVTANTADWQPNESTQTYTIAGTTPMELYRSIGERGPKTAQGNRAIAVTDWDLLWRRDYQKRGAGCILASALPFLTITYKMPKPSANLTGETAQRWQHFYAGIKAHEDVHGVLLQALTSTIIRDTVGLTTESDDGNCNALRAKVLAQVKIAFDAYRRDSDEFDRIEMAPGGNVRSLVRAFIGR